MSYWTWTLHSNFSKTCSVCSTGLDSIGDIFNEKKTQSALKWFDATKNHHIMRHKYVQTWFKRRMYVRDNFSRQSPWTTPIRGSYETLTFILLPEILRTNYIKKHTYVRRTYSTPYLDLELNSRYTHNTLMYISVMISAEGRN